MSIYPVHVSPTPEMNLNKTMTMAMGLKREEGGELGGWVERTLFMALGMIVAN